MPKKRAIIRWLSAEQGGRSSPPSDARGYVCPPRFISHQAEYQGQAWTLRIVDSTPLHGPEVIDATVEFVFEEAPHHWLAEGERFELMEGWKVVARGVIVPAWVDVPEHITDFELALLA